MKTLPDLSANVDDELDPPKNILMVMIDDMGLDGTPEADLHPDAVRVGNEEVFVDAGGLPSQEDK